MAQWFPKNKQTRATMVVIVTNIVVAVSYLIINSFLDFELLEQQKNPLFVVQANVMLALIFIIVQAYFIFHMLYRHYFKRRITTRELLKKPESDVLEFKSSLRWDYTSEKVNKNLEHAVLKTIAAFLNTHGGTLFIGVDDHNTILGIQKDYGTLKRKNADGFIQQLSTITKRVLGVRSFDLLKMTIERIDGHDVCRIDVSSSSEPVFFASGQEEHFYIRTLNMTISLPTKQAYVYITAKQKRQ